MKRVKVGWAKLAYSMKLYGSADIGENFHLDYEEKIHATIPQA